LLVDYYFRKSNEVNILLKYFLGINNIPKIIKKIAAKISLMLFL